MVTRVNDFHAAIATIAVRSTEACSCIVVVLCAWSVMTVVAACEGCRRVVEGRGVLRVEGELFGAIV